MMVGTSQPRSSSISDIQIEVAVQPVLDEGLHQEFIRNIGVELAEPELVVLLYQQEPVSVLQELLYPGDELVLGDVPSHIDVIWGEEAHRRHSVYRPDDPPEGVELYRPQPGVYPDGTVVGLRDQGCGPKVLRDPSGILQSLLRGIVEEIVLPVGSEYIQH